MKIFDCHTHITNSFESYDLDVSHKNIIFNTIEEYKNYRDVIKEEDFVSLIFDPSNLDFIKDEINSKRVQALKIHSRFQKLSNDKYDSFFNKLREFEPTIPIIYDAFYYGDEYEYRPRIERCIELIKMFPELPIIVAHSGGYEMIRYFMHLRQLKNVYYDLSLSLQFFYDSSLRLDLMKIIKFTDSKKIMFGSDYHYGSPKKQIKVLYEMMEMKTDLEKEDIVYNNAMRLFSNNI